MQDKMNRHEQHQQHVDRIDELNHLIAEAEKENKALTQEYTLLQEQFDRIETRYINRLYKMKRLFKLAIKYLIGKRHIKELFSRSLKQKKARNRIRKLRYQLYDMGFTKKARIELEKEQHQSDNPYVRRYAAWELALWYANEYTLEGAEKSIYFITEAMKGEKDRDFLLKSSILKAESYDIMGEKEEAKRVIAHALASSIHVDLYLAAANLESSYEEKIKKLNKIYKQYGLMPLKTSRTNKQTYYDTLSTMEQIEDQLTTEQRDKPKVSVIIPAYNAANRIQTALDSVLAQTWGNIEVIVVDDCSTDETAKIVEAYANKNEIIRLLSTQTNSGAYTARNEALTVATGEFVTVHDADDWSHPEKIEKQVTHLLENETAIANTSQQARATEDLTFYRRGKPGKYLFSNMSSLMFRRKPVMEKVGFWDCVRFGADGEFKKRLKLVYGEKAVIDLETGPYSFQRQSSKSLTGNQVFGYHGFFMGARKEYADAYNYYHTHTASLKYDYPQEKRLFPAPSPMLPTQEKTNRHYDVIIASDFRLLGGTNMSNIEEIKAQTKHGLRTGLVHLSRYDVTSIKEINPKVRELIDGDEVQMLVYGEEVSCDVLIVRHPPILQDWQKYIPTIKARHVQVIMNQPPKREYSENGKTLYNLNPCVKHLKSYFGTSGTWSPIGPLIRETLTKHHTEELKRITLAKEDWVNIIDKEEWRRAARPNNKRIRIGRHSRDQYVKWPAARDELQAIYPVSEKYEIHILGGATTPEKVLGELPANWHVHAFGDIHPRTFLSGLDIFVYFTHPKWIEAFGRVIFEAMAVGVPVIIPPIYQPLFKEAAIYAKPQEVEQKIDALMNDDKAYQKQVDIAHEYIEKHFGYSKHMARLEPYFLTENQYMK